MPAEALDLEGTVASGLGIGARFTSLAWVADAFEARLGFRPHPGTFNLRMEGASWEVARRRLASAPGIEIPPAQGFCAARCFRVLLEGRVAGAALFPDVPDYPADKLEVVAPVSVVEALGLRDGGRVKLRLFPGEAVGG